MRRWSENSHIRSLLLVGVKIGQPPLVAFMGGYRGGPVVDNGGGDDGGAGQKDGRVALID